MLRRIITILLLTFAVLPASAFAHHISSSASTWTLRGDEASVDFQYPLADVVVLVAPDRVLKQETYIEIIGDVDDALLEKTSAFLKQEIPQKILLSGCSFKDELNIRYQSQKVYIHGELACKPGYLDRLKLEDRFLVTVNRLHVSLATLDIGNERLKCLFRAGLYECDPKAAQGASFNAVPWKEVMGKGEVLVFHGWEQWCFLILLILVSAKAQSFARYFGVFIAGNLIGLAPLLAGRLPPPSQINILPPIMLLYGGLMLVKQRGQFKQWAWLIYWLGHVLLILLSLAGIFRPDPLTIAGMALVGFGLLSFDNAEKDEPLTSWPLYAFCALFGLLHGFALADGMRNYSTLGTGGFIASLGFDPSQESWRYLFMAAVLPLAAIKKIRTRYSWLTPSIGAMVAATGLCWMFYRGINLPGGGLNYRESVEALKNIVQNPNISPHIVLVSLILAVILGALHAITPGHGKTVVAAYLVGSKGKITDALILGITVTVTHTSSVLVLGVIALVASKSVLPGDLTPYMGGLSGIIIVIMGVIMLVTRFKNWRRTGEAIVVHDHSHFGLEQGHHDHQHHNHDHEHSHDHDHHSDHDHSHDEPRSGVRLFDLITLGISGGMVPCPDAFVVLLIAVAVGRIALGILLIVMFSLGMAAVLITVGILIVKARPLFDKFGGGGGLVRVIMPLASAALVTIIGIAITYQSLSKVF